MRPARLPLLRRIVLHLVAWTLVGLVPCQAIALSVAHALGPGHVHRPAAERDAAASTVTELCVALDGTVDAGDLTPRDETVENATAWCVPPVAVAGPAHGQPAAGTLRPRLPWSPTPSFETRAERPPRLVAG